jgi:hypothetical protein
MLIAPQSLNFSASDRNILNFPFAVRVDQARVWLAVTDVKHFFHPDEV